MGRARPSSGRSAAPTTPDRPGPGRRIRALGELADIRDDVADAVRLYRQAIELDPKIGVMKRLRALERLQDHPEARSVSRARRSEWL